MNDMSWKYVFVFAGTWNQFRDWMRRTQYDQTAMKANGEHVIYVDRWDKIYGYTVEGYKTAEIRVIGTFWNDQTDEMVRVLQELEDRIKQAKNTKVI